MSRKRRSALGRLLRPRRATAARERPLQPPPVSLPVPLSAPPGHDAAGDAAAAPLVVTCTDYSAEQVQVQEIARLDEFLARHRPDWCRVRWIDVAGLGRADAIRSLADKYQLHPLAVEDVLHSGHRPKADDYPGSGEMPGRFFVVARSVVAENGRMQSEQVSFFLGRTTLLTFRELPGDLFKEVRQRIEARGSRLRENDVSFLFYALMDAIVDGYFPILEQYSDRLEDVEEELLSHPDRATLAKVHAIKRELFLLRRAIWPMRDVIAEILREKHECLSETARTYFRDVYDHCVQVLDLVENYREIISALTETYMSVVSNRMNEIMKVLTIMGTIFIPLTFLAGVYGMNMPIPENKWPATYPVFWLVCAGVAAGMLGWFRWRRWI